MRYFLNCSLLALAALFFTACGQDTPKAPGEKAPTSPSAKTPNAQAGGTSETGEALEKLHIRKPNDDVVVTFRWNSEEMQILFNEGDNKRFLRSRLTQTRQRRYNERGVGPVALVRSSPKGPGFNIRSADGELWWRMRLGKKIAQIEDQTESVFQLRHPKSEIVQAVRTKGTIELGRAVTRKSRVRILDANGNLVYKVGRGAPDSMLYGLMVTPDLDTMARYILMAELLVRER